ncbi:MAG TPA: hypothetical protein VGP47_00845 [Parachlamydiaceae bacterium]|nr:hypothetical protein [Nitrosopumilus sp.]HEV8051012.1 hypothetical protein [Parachlamydiaceae bacterium]
MDIQRSLSSLQAIPVIGPLVFSPIKMGVSVAEMISGFAIGIIFGIGATVSNSIGANSLCNELGIISLRGFGHALTGFASLFYGASNLATLGLVGGCLEMSNWQNAHIGHRRAHLYCN